MKNHPLMLAVLALCALIPGGSRAEEFPPLFPFVISYDGPDNASSVAHLLDAPAGKHGFIRCENGHFVNDAGPVRLHATNITGPANFPAHEVSDKLAARLARFGINCVRLHYMDTLYGSFMDKPLQGILTIDPTTQRNLDPGQLDKLDYMIAAFKKHGIYIDMNLHVGLKWDERDGFTGTDKRRGMDNGLDNFEPRMIELQKEYARKLLTHVNPYTGHAYVDEPSVAVVEINNENALFIFFLMGWLDPLPDPYAAEFRRQWNDWLRKKYGSSAEMLKAWKWADTPLSDEQIPEGQFTKPLSLDGKTWNFALGSAQAGCKVREGSLRIEVTRGGADLFPKLFRKLSVKKDRLYTLSFRMRRVKGEDSSPLGLAVADTNGGWRSLGVLSEITVGRDWQNFAFPFVAADDCNDALLSLTRFKTGCYELDNLSFQSGARCDFDATKRLEEGAVPTLKSSSFAPRQTMRDFYQFLYDTEQKYWLGMYHYLKDELKLKSVVSGTQINGYSPPYIQSQLDYCDNHGYWCHPTTKTSLGKGRRDFEIRNEAMVNSLGGTITGLAGVRVLGKPYTVSECGHPFPNQFGAEGQPFLRAYGRHQGWDGVFEYSYNHYPNDYEPTANPWCYFDMIARTDILAHFPACAAMFLRGDVQEAKTTVVGAVSYATYFERLVGSKSVATSIGAAGFDARLALIHKTAVDLTGKRGDDPANVEKIPAGQKVFVSDTGELTWNVERPGAGMWTVNTPHTKFFTGFPEGRMIDLGDVKLEVGKTRLGWATVSLVSRQATGFGEGGKPASILVAATGWMENKGMVIKPVGEKTITLSDWGTGPVMMEGVPATITLPAAAERVKCFALDPHGDRKQAVPVAQASSGSKIEIKPEYQTIWYEVEVK